MKAKEGFSVLSVSITETTKRAFRRFVLDKHGTDKSMGFELDKILSDYLDRQPRSTHTQISRNKNRAIVQIIDIVHMMKNEGYTNQVVVERRETDKGNIHWGKSSDLGRVISQAKGTEQRTVDKYMNLLVDLGVLVNPIPVPNSRKLIYTVDLEPVEPSEGPLVMELSRRKSNVEANWKEAQS